MAHIDTRTGVRGFGLVAAGTVAAGLAVAVLFASGFVDLGLGAPAVRIDASSPTAWPQFEQ